MPSADGQIWINDIILSRYACYLALQNADPDKEVVALGQTYLIHQARKYEMQEKESSIQQIHSIYGIPLFDPNKSLINQIIVAEIEGCKD